MSKPWHATSVSDSGASIKAVEVKGLLSIS
jgi:hypothetical protein